MYTFDKLDYLSPWMSCINFGDRIEICTCKFRTDIVSRLDLMDIYSVTLERLYFGSTVLCKLSQWFLSLAL